MSETSSTTKSQENRLEVNEIRMMRLVGVESRRNKIRNEHVRGSVKVAPVTNKITENMLKRYGHGTRRGVGFVLDAPVPENKHR